MNRLLAACLGTAVLLAQIPPRGTPPDQLARIEGKVVNDRTQEPLRRAHVVLRPLVAGVTAIGVDADDKGNFAMRDIAPGRYTLLAQRDGYLPSSTSLRGTLRMPAVINIGSGQQIADLTFRLRPWAVLGGRVRYDDGEPAVNLRVDAYRQSWFKGRLQYSLAMSAGTDDRGEYRMHGLQPGAFVVAAAYDKAITPGYVEQGAVDAEGRELPATSYATTFYPDTVKLSEAVPVRLEYGQEVGGLDLFLLKVRKLKVRGRVLSGVTGQAVTTASLFLQRMDAESAGSLAAPAQAAFDREGQFEIKDVTPGAYVVWAEGDDTGERLIGRALLTATEQDVENLELLISPPRRWSAELKIEGGGRLDPRIALNAVLQPRSERGASVSVDVRNPGSKFWVMGDETYDLYIQNLPDDFYLSAVRVNGGDVMPQGVPGSGAREDRPLEAVVDSRGGTVAGRVFGPNGDVWSGANLMLAPDPAAGRAQAYRQGFADEYGQFMLRGVPPGKYVLVAWLDDPPCDYYDPGGIDACRATGMSVTIAQGGEENIEFNVKLP